MEQNTEQKSKPKMEKLGSLWNKVSSAGMDYSTGTLEIDGKKIQIIVFNNLSYCLC
jgi:hypothetical protein